MQVTDLIPADRKGTRSRVFLNDAYAFTLYQSELRKYDIITGSELSDALLREIQETILIPRAKKRAMALLQKRDYTERRLREKLADGGCPPACVDAALDYVKAFRYVDDERYARDYAVSYMERRSRTRIAQDLQRAGIAKEVYTAVLEDVFAQADPDTERRQAAALLAKRRYDPAAASVQEKRKQTAYLLRKGFSMDVVRAAIGREDG